MRIGVFGGTFNPPHIGHRAAAEAASRALKLDRLFVIPAAIPPHKELPANTAKPEDRLAMARAAFCGMDCAEVLDIELERGGNSYTVDTVDALRSRYPDAEMFLLMGTDMFLSFLTWREPEVIASLAAVVCMARVRADKALSAQLQAQKAAIRQTLGAEPIVLDNDCLEVSSTQVRRLLFFGLTDGQIGRAHV